MSASTNQRKSVRDYFQKLGLSCLLCGKPIIGKHDCRAETHYLFSEEDLRYLKENLRIVCPERGSNGHQ